MLSSAGIYYFGMREFYRYKYFYNLFCFFFKLN